MELSYVFRMYDTLLVQKSSYEFVSCTGSVIDELSINVDITVCDLVRIHMCVATNHQVGQWSTHYRQIIVNMYVAKDGRSSPINILLTPK